MAMLPFCGYNMSDYFAHWLRIGQREGAKLPRIFYVNWFLKDDNGKFLWPGFGENSRVLAWMFRRCEGNAEAQETPIGMVPPVGKGGIETEGLDLPAETLERLLEVDVEAWKAQMPQTREHYARFGDELPSALRGQLEALAERLGC
jgi:phosphoenolpyruvate carboxykinase (GTP)